VLQPQAVIYFPLPAGEMAAGPVQGRSKVYSKAFFKNWVARLYFDSRKKGAAPSAIAAAVKNYFDRMDCVLLQSIFPVKYSQAMTERNLIFKRFAAAQAGFFIVFCVVWPHSP
jgi:hypothetical protein